METIIELLLFLTLVGILIVKVTGTMWETTD